MPNPYSVFTHNTRSINCLIRSPQENGHSVSTAGGHHNQVFSPAGTWTGQDGSNFTPDLVDTFRIAGSSLAGRHAQARVMSWGTVTFTVSTHTGPAATTYGFYQHDTTFDQGNNNSSLPQVLSGQPVYGFSTGFPQGPCRMSTFTIDGITRGIATVTYTGGQPLYTGNQRAIKMKHPSPQQYIGAQPIAMGPGNTGQFI